MWSLIQQLILLALSGRSLRMRSKVMTQFVDDRLCLSWLAKPGMMSAELHHGQSSSNAPFRVIESAHKAPRPPMGQRGDGCAQCNLVGSVCVARRF